MPDHNDTAPQGAPLQAAAEAIAEVVEATISAELAMLSLMLPGMPRPGHPAPPVDEAEIESGFDNMPV